MTCDVVPYFWSDRVTDRIQFVGVPESDEVVTVVGSAPTGDPLALSRTGDRVRLLPRSSSMRTSRFRAASSGRTTVRLDGVG